LLNRFREYNPAFFIFSPAITHVDEPVLKLFIGKGLAVGVFEAGRDSHSPLFLRSERMIEIFFITEKKS